MASKKLYYTIRGAAEIIGVSESTLRFWEKNFDKIKPKKTDSGHRRYSIKDIDKYKIIKLLIREKGMSIEYAKTVIDGYRESPPRRQFSCKSNEKAIKLLSEVKKQTEDPHAYAKIEAVQNWISENEK